MAYSPPNIDQRTYEEIVVQIKDYAQQFSGWQPTNEATIDAGEALIRICAQMIELLGDRLNRMPDKNFLAFLDLIGAELMPPLPAKVPLTFYLVEGSSVDGLVPAQTSVAAPATGDDGEEILFETEQDLVVTTTQLQGVFVRQPSFDLYSDRTAEATGEEDAAFFVFTGDLPIPHLLYISCPEIFALPESELAEFSLTLTIDEGAQLSDFAELLIWYYWDGEEWVEVCAPILSDSTLTFTDLPIPTASEINGITAGWLQASLTDIAEISDNLPVVSNIYGSTDLTKSDLVPEICLFNSGVLDITKDFYPFGERGEFNDTFHIALHDSFVKPNAIVNIVITLSNTPTITDDFEITWTIGNGTEWREIATEDTEEGVYWTNEPINFVDQIEGELQFPALEYMPDPSTVNRETGYWIRAVITAGNYGTAADERQYSVYYDLAVVIDDAPSGSVITVNTVDLLNVDDRIVIQASENGIPFEYQIIAIDPGNSQITLDKDIDESIAGGDKVMRKSILTEVIAPVYNPPIVSSLKLSYDFTLTEDAIYCAYNGFNYSDSETFDTTFKLIPNIGDTSLTLENVSGLKVGEFLTIPDSEPMPTTLVHTQREEQLHYQIDMIFPETNQVNLTSGIQGYDSERLEVFRYFRPFLPTVEQEPTIYFGFDQSFGNKSVTLYARIEPPLPEELSANITSETVLTLAADSGEARITVADTSGWQVDDYIEIEDTQYTIVLISNNTATINPPLITSYPQFTSVTHSQQPKLIWEYSSPLGWQTLVVQEETSTLSTSGLIQFIAPADFGNTELFGKQLYWLRIRWLDGNFRVQPRLRRFLTNTMWAFQVTTFTDEVLGSSNNQANMVFVANNAPILTGQQLQIRESKLASNILESNIPIELESDRVTVIRDEFGEVEEIWVLWEEVPDFYLSGPGDRHYIVDRIQGEIQFGDGQTGMIPPPGRDNIRLSFYRTGGGKQGNVAAETISELRTTVPYIDRVINLEAAAGGSEQESLERFKQRAPEQLRHRDRAVTFEDVENLAYEASTDVARVKAIPPDLMVSNFNPLDENFWLDPDNPDITLMEHIIAKQDIENYREFVETTIEINNLAGEIKLIILPNSSDQQPMPSLILLEQVEAYIRSCCPTTMDLLVTSPIWQAITVTTTVTPLVLEEADMVRSMVKQRLEEFLHPLTGGTGEGWDFARYPQKSDFYNIIQSVSGVSHVDELEVEPSPEDNLILSADCVIYSGNHVVNMTS